MFDLSSARLLGITAPISPVLALRLQTPQTPYRLPWGPQGVHLMAVVVMRQVLWPRCSDEVKRGWGTQKTPTFLFPWRLSSAPLWPVSDGHAVTTLLKPDQQRSPGPSFHAPTFHEVTLIQSWSHPIRESYEDPLLISSLSHTKAGI